MTLNASLGPQVRSLYLDTYSHLDLRAIIPRTKLVNLIGLSPCSVTPKIFSDLGKYSGSTLVRLEGVQIAKGAKVEKASMFSLFRRIRSLSVGFKSMFNTSSIPTDALATLEELTLLSFDETLITVFSHMECATSVISSPCSSLMLSKVWSLFAMLRFPLRTHT
jgi:hypothetical protein